MTNARVATKRVWADVCLTFDWNRRAVMRRVARRLYAVRLRVDWTAISACSLAPGTERRLVRKRDSHLEE